MPDAAGVGGRSQLFNPTPYDIDRGLLVNRQGKGHKDRVVPITQRAIDWLDKYLSKSRPWIEAGNAITRNNGCKKKEPMHKLILGNNGSAMHLVLLTQLVRNYLTQAGITKSGSCHILRHTTATLMLENGADLPSLQRLLGHANLNIAQIYLRSLEHDFTTERSKQKTHRRQKLPCSSFATRSDEPDRLWLRMECEFEVCVGKWPCMSLPYRDCHWETKRTQYNPRLHLPNYPGGYTRPDGGQPLAPEQIPELLVS